MGVVLLNPGISSNSNNSASQPFKVVVHELLLTSPDNIPNGKVSVQHLPQEGNVINLVFALDVSKYLNKFKDLIDTENFIIEIQNLTRQKTLVGKVTNIANDEVKITIEATGNKTIAFADIKQGDELLVDLDFSKEAVFSGSPKRVIDLGDVLLYDFGNNEIEDAVSVINDLGFTVNENEEIYFTVKTGQIKGENIEVSKFIYEFKNNHILGEYGIDNENGQITSDDLIALAPIYLFTVPQNSVFLSLGNINDATLPEHINELPLNTYVLDQVNTSYYFTAIQNGTETAYKYVGQLPISLSGNTTVTATDFDAIAIKSSSSPTNLSAFVDDIGATDALLPNVIFVDPVNGDDTTGTIENISKPFKTHLGAYNAIPTFDNSWSIEILGTSTFNVTESLYNYYLVAKRNLTIDLSNHTFTLANNDINIKAPNATILISGSLARVGSNNNPVNIEANILNINTTGSSSQGIITGKGSIIKLNQLIFNTNQPVFSTAGQITIEKITINASNSKIGVVAGTKLSTEFLKIGEINVNNTSNTAFIDLSTAEKNITISKITGTGTLIFNLSQGSVLVFDDIEISPTVNFNPLGLGLYGYLSGSININSILNLTYFPSGNMVGLRFVNFRGKVSTATKFSGNGNSNQGIIEIINSEIILDDDNLIIDTTFGTGVTGLTSITIENSSIYTTSTNTEQLILNVSADVPAIIRGYFYTNFKALGKNINYTNETSTFKEKSKEIVIKSKLDLVNKTLDTSLTYIIDGVIEIEAGEYIEVPAGGNLTINGYGLEASNIIKNVAGESIFKSPVVGSGGLQMDAIKFTMGTPTTSCFDLTDATGFNAVECVKVNFEGSGNIGLLNGYRQYLWTNIGIFGLGDGLTLEGTSIGGFSSNSIIVRNLSGTTGTLFKKGASFSMASRFNTNANIDIPSGWSILDFEDANFVNPNSLQLQGMFVTRAGVSNENDALYFPNINEESDKCDWKANEGIKNSAISFEKIKSPDGTVWKLEVDNAGVITATAI